MFLLKRTPLLRKREDFLAQHANSFEAQGESHLRAQQLLWLEKFT